jgi:hypothetical protein
LQQHARVSGPAHATDEPEFSAHACRPQLQALPDRGATMHAWGVALMIRAWLVARSREITIRTRVLHVHTNG